MKYLKWILEALKLQRTRSSEQLWVEQHAEEKLTEYLKNSKTFEKISHKIHEHQRTFWEKIDEAAFPEEHKEKQKLIKDEHLRDKQASVDGKGGEETK
jgi:hypothetical protein